MRFYLDENIFRENNIFYYENKDKKYVINNMKTMIKPDTDPYLNISKSRQYISAGPGSHNRNNTTTNTTTEPQQNGVNNMVYCLVNEL